MTDFNNILPFSCSIKSVVVSVPLALILEIKQEVYFHKTNPLCIAYLLHPIPQIFSAFLNHILYFSFLMFFFKYFQELQKMYFYLSLVWISMFIHILSFLKSLNAGVPWEKKYNYRWIRSRSGRGAGRTDNV